MLANLYMNRFLKHWRKSGCGEAFRARLINYADDFVILSRGHAAEAMAWTAEVMTRLGLTLNAVKTELRDARKEHFDFLGYTFGPYFHRKKGIRYLGAAPSSKSVRRLTTKVGELLVPGNHAQWPKIRDRLNTILEGWAAYFCYDTRLMAYRAVENYVADAVRRFLRRRHKVQTRGTRCFPPAEVFGPLGVVRLRDLHLGPLPCASR